MVSPLHTVAVALHVLELLEAWLRELLPVANGVCTGQGSSLFTQSHAAHVHVGLCYELTATFDPTMRFKRSNSNLEKFHDVFGVAAFSLLLTPWRDIS